VQLRRSRYWNAMSTESRRAWLVVLVAALGYFVDI